MFLFRRPWAVWLNRQQQSPATISHLCKGQLKQAHPFFPSGTPRSVQSIKTSRHSPRDQQNSNIRPHPSPEAMAATLPTKSVPHPSSLPSSPSSSDTDREEDSHPLNKPRILQPLVSSPPRQEKKSKKRPHKPSTRSPTETAGFSSSDEGELLADEAGRPGLEHESESEDLEMSDYPHTGDEGGSRAPTPDGRNGGKRRRRGGLNSREGEGAGVGLGDRLVMADGDRPVISDEEKKVADGKVLRDMAINALFIGLWLVHFPIHAGQSSQKLESLGGHRLQARIEYKA